MSYRSLNEKDAKHFEQSLFTISKLYAYARKQVNLVKIGTTYGQSIRVDMHAHIGQYECSPHPSQTSFCPELSYIYVCPRPRCTHGKYLSKFMQDNVVLSSKVAILAPSSYRSSRISNHHLIFSEHNGSALLKC